MMKRRGKIHGKNPLPCGQTRLLLIRNHDELSGLPADAAQVRGNCFGN
jgi:hypothetical protein